MKAGKLVIKEATRDNSNQLFRHSMKVLFEDSFLDNQGRFLIIDSGKGSFCDSGKILF